MLGSIIAHIPLLGGIPRNGVIQVIIEQSRRIQNRWRVLEHRKLMIVMLSLLNWMAIMTRVEWEMQTATSHFDGVKI